MPAVGQLIDLGLVDGNYWNAGHVDQIEAAINAGQPAGMVIMTVAAAAPTGWLLLAGQVVASAQTLYPSLWAVAPLVWKSGATLTLPNMASSFPIGQAGAIGTIGGANTTTIATANLPVHHHAISGYTSDAVDHTWGGSGQHVHNTYNGAGGATQLVAAGGAGFPVTNALIPLTGGSYKTIDAGTMATSIDLGHHQHDLTGNTSDVGSGTAMVTVPAYVTFNFLIRAY
jgi:microcystin-dependent protein